MSARPTLSSSPSPSAPVSSPGKGREGESGAPACVCSCAAAVGLVSPTSGPSHRSVSSVLLLRLSNGDSELLFFPLWVSDFQSGVEEALPPLLGSQASRATAAATPTAAHALLLLLLLLFPALHQEIRRKDANGLGSRRRTLLRRPEGGRHRHLQDPQRMPSSSRQFGMCLPTSVTFLSLLARCR